MTTRDPRRRLKIIPLTLVTLFVLAVLAACGDESEEPVDAADDPDADDTTTTEAEDGDSDIDEELVESCNQSDLESNPELDRLITAAAEEGTVRWASSFDIGEFEIMIDTFLEEFPCIEGVELSNFRGLEDRERLLREFAAGQYNYDVLNIGPEMFPDFDAVGALEPYDWSLAFPIQDGQVDDHGWALKNQTSIHGIAYNSDLLDRDEVPTDWWAFTEPEWEGRFVVDTRPIAFGRLRGAMDEEEVLALAEALGNNNPIFRRGQTESIQLMGAGEYPVIVGGAFDSTLGVKSDGAPVDFVVPDPLPVGTQADGITSEASNPNAAKLFVGWLGTVGNWTVNEGAGSGLHYEGYESAIRDFLDDLDYEVTLAEETAEDIATRADFERQILEAFGVE